MSLFAKFLTSRGEKKTGAVIPYRGFHIFVSFESPAECYHHLSTYAKWTKKSRKALALARKLNKVTTEILSEHEFGWIHEIAGATTETEQSAGQPVRADHQDQPATSPAAGK